MKLTRTARHSASLKICLTSLTGIVLFMGAVVFWLAHVIPVGREAVIADIERRTGAKVQIGRFQQEWLPPSVRAEAIRISDSDGDVMTIDSAFASCSYTGMLQRIKSVRTIEGRGIHLVIPPRPGNVKRRAPNFLVGKGNDPIVRVDEIKVQDAVLDLPAGSLIKSSLTYSVRELVLEHVGQAQPTAYRISLRNAFPDGNIRSSGYFGPVDLHHLTAIPMSGDFIYEHVDLTIPHAITGLLGATGKFSGTFGKLRSVGTADVPNFLVSASSHPVHVATTFDITVNVQDGNGVLNAVVAHYNRTTVVARGDFVSAPGAPGKVVTINTEVHDGRVEDLLLLFTHKLKPSMNGAIRLKSRFTIPPGPPGFLQRLGMEGAFEIAQGKFNSPKVQSTLNRLSDSARGETKAAIWRDRRSAPTALGASVSGRDGIARLKNVVFDVPGVHGNLSGDLCVAKERHPFHGHTGDPRQTLRYHNWLQEFLLEGYASQSKTRTFKNLSGLYHR